MKQYYECHITMLGEPEAIKTAVHKASWHFSKIDGDPDLGKGIKCYATKHYNIRFADWVIIDALNQAAERIASNCDVIILRKKIEKVLYDERIKPINDIFKSKTK